MAHPPPQPSILPVPALAEALAPADAGDTPSQQQCGRCRLFFDGDPTLHASALPEWWLCAECRMRLLPDRA